MAISKNVLKNINYWKTLRAVSKNNFNTTGSVDGHVGSKHIANHFKKKINKLFNIVRTSDIKLSNFQKSISNKVSTDSTLYLMLIIRILHNVILYQSMMLEKLKTDKIDEQGNVFQIILFMVQIYYIDIILFTSMINHGYTPAEYLKPSMLQLPKGA